tara:strand:- start:13533 stop:15422 length:1890 start_codon:yes stop_codon:yes gene_type:complete
MCGICGLISYSKDDNEIASIVTSMVQKLDHRGPDGNGVYNDTNITLGHTRLSIIDLSESGSQPMVDPRGYIITYNGELYNYKDLRKRLELKGEVFNSESDTEVVLKSYIHWGTKSLDYFNGMFAFAIYNKNEKLVFLARDRVGIKTLYYDNSKRELLFASEIKSILNAKNNYELDYQQIPFYLKYGYFPREKTPLSNIRQLKPGHFITWQEDKVNEECYWDAANFIDNSNIANSNSLNEINELNALILDSIKKQMASDVPIGSLLSGGIDSSLVSTHLQMLSSEKINTFTMVTPDSNGVNEGILSSNLSKKLGTRHHELKISSNELISNWEYIFNHFDQPFADTSALPFYLLSKFVKNKVKVVMSGDGGDEQWGGYGNYQKYKQLETIDKNFPNLFRNKENATFRIIENIARVFSNNTANKINYYKNMLCTNKKNWHSIFDNQIGSYSLKSIYGQRLDNHKNKIHDDYKFSEVGENIDGFMLNDLKLFMVDSVLRKVDMMSMLNGLEVRVPLLDHRIVEKSLGLSSNLKVSNFSKKIIGKKIAERYLPKDTINAKKMGFSIPVDAWIRGEFRQITNDVIRSSSFKNRGILNHKSILKILDDHDKGLFNNGKFIMSVLILENWFINNDVK